MAPDAGGPDAAAATDEPAVTSTRTAIVLAGGEAPHRGILDRLWPGWDAGVSIVVAADDGARHGAALGLTIDRWVGDGDSIDEAALDALATAGVEIVRVPVAKDATDTELALVAAIELGAERLVLIGALGGPRIDHALANLDLLRHPLLGTRRVVAYDRLGARISVLAAVGGPATVSLEGRVGDLVSLLPVDGPAEGVTTRDLEYALADEPLLPGRTRGISNVRMAAVASITLRSGRLLVIETPANLDR